MITYKPSNIIDLISDSEDIAILACRTKGTQTTENEYKLSELLACMTIFQTIKSQHTTDQPKQWLQPNLQQIEAYFNKELGAYINTHVINEKSSSNLSSSQQTHINRIRSIYMDLCTNPELRSSLSTITNNRLTMKYCLNIDRNLAECIFETNCTKCQCGSRLTRNFRTRSGSSGAKAICYDNINGPQTAISYTYVCSRKTPKCSNKYKFGWWTGEGNTMAFTHLKNSNYYQCNNDTFYHKNIFAELELGLIEDGDSFSSFASRYNTRFHDKFQHIKKATIHVGRRQSPEMQAPLLSDSYFMFKLQAIIEDTFNDILHITNNDFTIITNQINARNALTTSQQHVVNETKLEDDIDIAITDNQNINNDHNNTQNNNDNYLTSSQLSMNSSQNHSCSSSSQHNYSNSSQNSNHSSSQNSNHTSSQQSNRGSQASVPKRSIFNHMFDKYEERIASIVPDCCRQVPAKKGRIFPGATSVYGDGNCKVHRGCCMMPRQILQ